jgi:bifunctional non-homologous end joining protein LigD
VRQGWVTEGEQQPAVQRPAEPQLYSDVADAVPALREPVRKTINFSNLGKVYWPAERYTKGDMIEYYRAVSPWLLPYLRNRPLVMTRYPDGIDGKMFYQKDAPEFAPEWIRTVKVWSEDTQREIRYFVVDDEESLLYVANLGTIPLHIWASSVGSLELCDWCVIDLDPKDAPFKDVITCAQVLHRLCESVALPHYVKTTGKTGLHILLPLGRQCTYAQSRTLGELLARVVLRELNDVATITRHVTKRGDKVYLDCIFEIPFAEAPPYIQDAVVGADALCVITPWNEFKQANLSRVVELMREPLVLDGRNLYDADEMRSLGFTYVGVGR